MSLDLGSCARGKAPSNILAAHADATTHLEGLQRALASLCAGFRASTQVARAAAEVAGASARAAEQDD